MFNRREFIRHSLIAGAASGLAINNALATEMSAKEIQIGLIGLDTSHSPAYTKFINDPKNPAMQGFKVAFAYPYGSTKIESSASRIPQYTQEIKALGVQVVDTLNALVEASDVVMLMTNDGNLHLEQILPVLKARKNVYVDKPVAAHLGDVIKIYDAVKQAGVSMFSSSPLRYIDGAQQVRYHDAVGSVIGADAYSPQKTEPSHTDLYWYGIHGVEILFTMMGPGCAFVKRTTEKEQDIVVGKWTDGRIGTYKGDLQGRQFYGGTAYGTKGVLSVGPFAGYQSLAEVIIQFFRDGKAPVDEKETMEIYTFMEAADESKKQGGEWVSMQKIYNQAAAASKK
ncbi:MAG: Gfo/Idh/MocA family oxidoreductase [Cyclobacteriaceae bacterium]|jgi:predicted dehydrogenase|nr:Gfo/Idh/MocA family oxidoreductase [Cyclobacteriaceae bacterium]MDH5249247.1 Gfo/Idh/MocA family oxidoreductase [Cyclobacteriaceae bacterium]